MSTRFTQKFGHVRKHRAGRRIEQCLEASRTNRRATIAPRHAPKRTLETAISKAVSLFIPGVGVTREVGMDLKDMGVRRALVLSDPVVSRLPPVRTALESLEENGVSFALHDRVRVEPTDESFLDAIGFATSDAYDAFVAVGGGSTIDTAKAVNLYVTSNRR